MLVNENSLVLSPNIFRIILVHIKLIETNEIIGEHYGLHRYTVGQRITPINRHYKSSEPLFIAKKDPIENIIYAVKIKE